MEYVGLAVKAQDACPVFGEFFEGGGRCFYFSGVLRNPPFYSRLGYSEYPKNLFFGESATFHSCAPMSGTLTFQWHTFRVGGSAKPGQAIQIRESKTGKTNTLYINREVYKALRGHLEASNHSDDDYLFQSRRGHQKPLTIMTVSRMIKEWCKTINLEGNYGAHSLRKTFGYIQRTKFGVGFELICKRFNHSSPSVTMRYLGIEDKEVLEILTHEI